MGCDYYIHSDLVIEYFDNKGTISTTRTNRTIEKCYICDVPDEDSDDDQETQYKKYIEEIERLVLKNTYKKILYENEKWIKTSYEKKYAKDLPLLCPGMVKIVKIYKDYGAWRCN